jgi:PAS domain S-box-containing protein
MPSPACEPDRRREIGKAATTQAPGSAAAGPSSERLAEACAQALPFARGADLVLVVGRDGLVLHVGDRWSDFFGGRPPPAPGQPLVDALASGPLMAPDARSLAAGFDSARNGSRKAPILLRTGIGEADASVLEGWLYGPLEPTGNHVLAFHEIRDGWERLSMLVDAERRFRTIAKATRDLVTETDATGRFTYVSQGCTDVLGYPAEELLSTPPIHLHHPEGRRRFLHTLESNVEPGRPFQVEPHRLRHRDGHWVWVEATGVRYLRPDGELRLVGVARDITARVEAEDARRRLEATVRQAQKLENLGIIAGGIAHDFNNLLTPIVGAAGVVLADLPEDSPIRRRIETIRVAADRATALTGQLLAYAGQTSLQFAAVDASEAVAEVSILLESAAPNGAAIRWDLAEHLPPIRADKGQVQQVILNLVANAAESLGARGGRVEIRTGVVDADRALLSDCLLGDEREEGRYVHIDVIDDGQGMDSEARERLFDPFFTTKFTGRGLGLSVVLGVVRGHAGALRVESEPGRGSTIRVLFPVCEDAPRAPATQPEATRAPEWRGTGTILVVDDDSGAREIISLLLERSGFCVRAAAGGPEAIEIFRRYAAEVVGVVLDSTMPEMSGASVFDAIRRLGPEVPILVISGYAEERVAQKLLERGPAGFLRKPFDLEELVGAIRRLVEPG